MNIDTLQAAILLSLAGTLFLFERHSASRRMAVALKYRWLTNISLTLLGGLIVGWVFSTDPLSVAQSLEGGLLSSLDLPLFVEIILVFLIIDLWRYWEHRVFHEVPIFWRVHLVHHSDPSIDITTTHRHHPIEPLITTLLMLMLVFALGFSALSLSIYFIVAGIVSLISHANIRIPEPLDAAFRLVLVTPAVHAIHHSSLQPQTDSNYGSILTIWDRLFGTYNSPKNTSIPHFGLEYFYKPTDSMLGPILLQPFQFHKGLRGNDRQPQDHLESEGTLLIVSPAWKKALQYGGLGLGLAMVALWPIAANLAAIWNSSEAYLINWLVVPMFLYALCWHQRDQLLAQAPQPGYAGLSIVALGLSIWCVAEILNINLGRHVAFVVLLQGIAICALGFKLWWKYLPAFLMLFLLVPSGDLLQPILRQLTIYWVQGFSALAGLPFRSEGYLLWVAEQRYIVVDACSGLSFVVLGLFMGYYFGVLLFRALVKIMALALLGACLGVLANAIRVSTIVWLDYVNGSQMPLTEHGHIAWLCLLFVMGLLLLLIVKLNPEAAVKQAANDEPSTNNEFRPGYAAPIIAGLALISAAYLPATVSAFASPAYAAYSPLNQAMLAYPTSDWQIKEKNNQKILTLQLNENIAVTIQEALDNQHLAAQPLQLGEGANWRHQRTQQINLCSNALCASYSLATWIKREHKQDKFQHLFFAYHMGNEVTNSVLRYRLAQAWNRITGTLAPHGMIGIMVQGDAPNSEELASLYQQLRQGR